MKKTAALSAALILALSVQGFVPSNGAYSFNQLSAASQESETEIPSLKDTFENCFMMGTEVTAEETEKYGDLIKRQYNILKPKELMYPSQILDKKNCSVNEDGTVSVKVKFSDELCRVIKFCEENGIAFMGGPLVWYSATPDWFFKENFETYSEYVKPEEMNIRLEAYIRSAFETLAEKFPDLKVYSYDICYELFLNDGGGMRGESQSDWVKVYGDSDEFVLNAFRYARKYAPEGCSLQLSDYNIEIFDEKTDDVYNLALKLKEEKLIDGISIESPVAVALKDIHQRYEKAIDKLSSTGLNIQITELEFDSSHVKDADSVEICRNLFGVLADKSSSISAVITFGISDNRSSGYHNYQCNMFDIKYEPKDLFYAAVNYSKDSEPEKNPPSYTAGTGDASLDGAVTTADLVVFMKYLLVASDVSPEAYNEMDVTGDGAVNILDFIKLKSVLLESGTQLSA